MTAAKIRAKIDRLNALIGHSRTGDEERDAAKRMLKRLQAKADVTAGRKPVDRRAYGSKYDHDKWLSLTEVAALIRADIKLARKIGKRAAEPGALKTVDPIGDAPAELRFSVRKEQYTVSGRIDITIRNIPAQWGFTKQERYGEIYDAPTPALQALANALKEILDAYNYDGSDLDTDYFDVRFYGHVRANGCDVA
jgi:hypothetical protein